MKASLVANPKVKVESLRIATINLGGKKHDDYFVVYMYL